MFSLCLVVSLAGCSGSSGQAPQNTNTVSGNAVKGLISNGIVNAYSIAEDGSYAFVSKARTSTNGRFSLEFDIQTDTLLLLELKADQHSRMTCDLANGCIIPGTGDLAEFGEDFGLPEQFSLLGIKPANAKHAYLSPLSHIIATTAAKLDGGLTQRNVELASQWLQADLNLEHDPLLTETPDITQLQDQLSESQLNQGIMGASFFYYAFLEEWQAHTLTLDDLSLTDLFNTAADLAENLAYLYADSLPDTAQQLASISSAQQDNASQSGSDALVILSQPQSLSAVEGETIVLRVKTGNAIAVSYQWYRDNELIPGAVDQVLSIPSAEQSDQGLYHVVISDGQSELQSLSAQVNVHAVYVPLQIVKHPQSQSLSPGQSLTLSIETLGGGDNLTFQWRKGGSIIPGATSDSLTLSNVSSLDEGSYSVTLSDGNRTLESQAAVINVTDVVLPVTIHNHPQSVSTIAGRAITLNVNASGGGYLGYQWRKNGVPLADANSAYLSINPVQRSDEGFYDVVISNSQGSVISDTAEVIVLSDVAPIVILAHPQSTSVASGNNASFSVSASVNEGISYQWYHNYVAIPQSNSSELIVDNAGPEDAGVYHVVLESENETVASFSALLVVEALPAIALSWDIPTQREDGQTLGLAEIQGYAIEYGTSLSNLDSYVQIEGATNTQTRLEHLDAGTYHFRIATIDSDGVAGDYSSPISITIN